jgi:hypothetical protein
MEKISWTDYMKMRKYYEESRRRRISYIQYKGGSLIELVTSGIGTAL